MKNKVFYFAVALFCVLAVGTLGTARVHAEVGVTDKEILFGSFQDMSGPGAYLGRLCTTTLSIWVNYVNKELGGIHGRKLKFVVEDNKYDPVLTKTAFNKLVNQHKVFALIMVYGSTPCTAVKEDIKKEKIPTFPTAATVQSMFDPPNRYLFWYASSDEDNAIMMVDHIVNNMKPKNPVIGVCYQDDEWGKSAVTGAKLACKKYGLKLVTAGYKRGSKNLNSQSMRLKAKGVTHCFFAGYAPVYAALLMEANKIGWKPVFFGDYVSVDPRTFMAGKLAHGHYHYFNLGVRSERTPGWKKIERLFTAAGAEKLLHVPILVLLWNPMLFLTQALQDCGRDLTREKLVDALESIKNFDTEGLGWIEYGPNMRKGNSKYRLLQADANKKIFVPVSDWGEPSIVWGSKERPKIGQ